MTHPIKWMTRWSCEIIRVEILRETDQFVWRLTDTYYKDGRHHSKPQREKKRSSYYTYHDTWEEAHAYLVEQAENQVTAARRNLQDALSRLDTVKDMKPPEAVS